METYRILPVRVGYLAHFEKSTFTYGRNAGEKIEAPCIVWVVTNGRRTVVVDAGPSAPERARAYHPAYTCPPEEELGRALAAHGIDPEQVDTVVVSHLHWDHVGGMPVFPRATFLVQRDELFAACDPIATQRVTYETGIRGLPPVWTSVFDRIQVCRGDFELAPGLRVVRLPGHTPGLQGLLVDTEAGPALIASDAVPLVDNWLGDAGLAHIPNGIHVDLSAYEETFAKMERLARWVLPGHDPAAFDGDRFPVESRRGS
ncbi:MAG: N-acyl homoserine lactonase family protein [Actinomycetia bacterium]|nr:N-acyl homoserine lactonase family protein [Actinomycetes bacterium]